MTTRELRSTLTKRRTKIKKQRDSIDKWTMETIHYYQGKLDAIDEVLELLGQ